MVVSELTAATMIAVFGLRRSYRIILRSERVIRRHIFHRPLGSYEGYHSFPRYFIRQMFRAGLHIALRWEGRAKNAAQRAREARLRAREIRGKWNLWNRWKKISNEEKNKGLTSFSVEKKEIGKRGGFIVREKELNRKIEESGKKGLGIVVEHKQNVGRRVGKRVEREEGVLIRDLRERRPRHRSRLEEMEQMEKTKQAHMR